MGWKEESECLSVASLSLFHSLPRLYQALIAAFAQGASEPLVLEEPPSVERDISQLLLGEP